MRDKLIISAYSVAPTPAPSALLDELQANAMKSVESANSNPDLMIIRELAPAPDVCILPCQLSVAQATSDGILFAQAIVSYGSGVLLATMEAPGDSTAFKVFCEFLGTIRRLENN